MKSREIALLLALAAAVPVGYARAQQLPGPREGVQLAEASVARISLAEFKKLYDAGQVVVLDVRGAQSYREGHIPGAISVPLETAAARASAWTDSRKTIVTYCS